MMSTASQSPPRLTFRRLPLVASGKQYDDDYNDEVLNWAGSTLAVPYFGPKNGVHLTNPSRVCKLWGHAFIHRTRCHKHKTKMSLRMQYQYWNKYSCVRYFF